MSKFDKAHLELRLYLPLEGDAMVAFKETEFCQALVQQGLKLVHSPKRVSKPSMAAQSK